MGSVDISTGLCCSPETRTFSSRSAMVVRGAALRVKKARKEKSWVPRKVLGCSRMEDSAHQEEERKLTARGGCR